MSVVENNTIVLPGVDICEDNEINSRMNLLMELDGEVKRYNLSTKIMNHFTPIEENLEQIQNENIALESRTSSLEEHINDEDTGILKQIEVLSSRLDTQESKKMLEGYRVQFIDSTDDFNLLTKNATKTFSFINNDLNIAECAQSGSGYSVNMYLDISYQMKSSATNYISNTIYSTAVINLNSYQGAASMTKQVALTLPLTDTVIVLSINLLNNDVKMMVKNYFNTNSIEDNSSIRIEFGEFEVKYVGVISNGVDDNEPEETPEVVINIPLTLKFDPRDIRTYGNDNETLDSAQMMYGSKIKFDAEDVEKGISFKVKYDASETEHSNDVLQYIGDKMSRRGNVIKIKDADSDIIPVPQVIYYDSVYSNFGIKAASTWFKYWDIGYVSEITFNNYNYNGGIGHQIKYTQDSTIANTLINEVNFKRIDANCIPLNQWLAFFGTYDQYAFDLKCTINNNIKKINSYAADGTIFYLYLEDDTTPAVVCVDYKDSVSTIGLNNIRAGMYLRNDIEDFSISVVLNGEQ